MPARRVALPFAFLLAACAGNSLRAGAEAPCRAATVDPAALRAHVETLATRGWAAPCTRAPSRSAARRCGS
jgi:hypothetical protein